VNTPKKCDDVGVEPLGLLYVRAVATILINEVLAGADASRDLPGVARLAKLVVLAGNDKHRHDNVFVVRVVGSAVNLIATLRAVFTLRRLEAWRRRALERTGKELTA